MFRWSLKPNELKLCFTEYVAMFGNILTLVELFQSCYAATLMLQRLTDVHKQKFYEYSKATLQIT